MSCKRKIVPLTDEQRRLAEENIRLTHFVINKYYAMHAYDDEVNSAALEGLIIAAQKWDESRGSFTTFAAICIRTMISKYFSAMRAMCRDDQKHRAADNTLRRISRGEEFEVDIFETMPSNEDLEGMALDRITVSEALDILPPDMREIIHMMYFEDIQQKDVAVHQGISPQGVDYRKRCALKMLKEYFEKKR